MKSWHFGPRRLVTGIARIRVVHPASYGRGRFIYLAPLAIYALIVAVTPPLRRGVQWLRFRAPGRRRPCLDSRYYPWLFHRLGAMVRAGAARRQRSRGEDSARRADGTTPDRHYVSLANALMEEAIFRGVFQEALTAEWGPWPAIVIQGVLFGVVHIQGFPRGLAGLVMASGYGIALGWLRLRSGGMAASCIAHVCADATIFALLVLRPVV